MPMVNIPIGGASKDFGSKKSVATAINMHITVSEQGDFVKVSRTAGLKEFLRFGTGAVRAMLQVDDIVYVVMGSRLYFFDKDGNVFELAVIGGSGQAALVVEPSPNREVLVLNGAGDGFIVNSGLVTQIVDPEFVLRKPKKATFLNGRFWLLDSVQTNFAFGSALNNFLVYPASTVFSAEEHSDPLVGIVAKKSSLYLIGTKTIEIWQAANDVSLPLRKAVGATIHRGCIAPDSIAELDDGFAMLADDYTVQIVGGNQIRKVSDYDLEVAIKGLGNTQKKRMQFPDEAVGFWVDGGSHKTYCLTFKKDKYTWCHDVVVGTSHLRESQEDDVLNGYWRGLYSVQAFGKTFVGDQDDNVVWEYTLECKKEGDNPLTAILRSAALTSAKNFTVPLIEIDMETGVSESGLVDGQPNIDYLQASVSKDGGKTWVASRSVSLGRIADYRHRVPFRQFGRVVRNSSMVLELRTSAAVDITIYGAQAMVNESVF